VASLTRFFKFLKLKDFGKEVVFTDLFFFKYRLYLGMNFD
jgi:hypothetical protein